MDRNLSPTGGQPKLPSTEVRAIVAAQSVAQAMLENEADADPLAIKSRAQAAVHLCDERRWPAARREFAYAALCCEFRWTRENPAKSRGRPAERTPNQNSDRESELNPRQERRLRETYDEATADDLREAKSRADAEGRAVTRGKVRETADENNVEAVLRKAEAAAKRQAKKRPLEGIVEFQKEQIEILEAELAEAHVRLAEVAVDLDDEITGEDAAAEAKKAMQKLRRLNEHLHADNSALREKVADLESQVVHWKTYAGQIEEVLQRRGYE